MVRQARSAKSTNSSTGALFEAFLAWKARQCYRLASTKWKDRKPKIVIGKLFTIDFLREGITATPAWKTISAPAIDEFRTAVSKSLGPFLGNPSHNEAVTESKLILPVLAALGWTESLPQQTSAWQANSTEFMVARRLRRKASGCNLRSKYQTTKCACGPLERLRRVSSGGTHADRFNCSSAHRSGHT